MKLFSTLILLIISSNYSLSQTVCGSIGENGTLTLTAPPGMVFNAIVFASYGTPTGSCGSFATSGCHAVNSATIVGAALIGQNSASIPATNGIFGDPCGGTVKLLAVEASYLLAVPLTLKSFSAKIGIDNKTNLRWITNDEINTSHFVIERSEDGRNFQSIGEIPAKGKSVNNYDFNFIPATVTTNNFYRLKMLDKDEKFTYSKVVLLRNTSYTNSNISVFPNPVKDIVTVSGLEGRGKLRILNIKGELLQQINVTGQSLLIDMSKFVSGNYILQYQSERNQRIFKFIKE